MKKFVPILAVFAMLMLALFGAMPNTADASCGVATVSNFGFGVVAAPQVIQSQAVCTTGVCNVAPQAVQSVHPQAVQVLATPVFVQQAHHHAQAVVVQNVHRQQVQHVQRVQNVRVQNVRVFSQPQVVRQRSLSVTRIR